MHTANMASFIKVTFWLILIIGSCCAEEDGKAKTLLKMTGKFVPYLEKAMELWDGYLSLIDTMENKPLDTNQQIAALTVKVDQISKDNRYYHDDLSNTLNQMELESKLSDKMTSLYRTLNDIKKVNGQLVSVLKIKNPTYYNLEPSVKSILDNKMALNLRQIIIDLTESKDVDYNIFQLLLDPELKDKKVCSAKVSIQQLLHNHYREVHNTLIKGLLMLIWAYETDQTASEQDKEQGIQLALTNHFELLDNLTQIFDHHLDFASRDMWMCDPKSPQEGKTYERFGRAFQKYLFNVRNIAPPLPGDDKKKTCHLRCEDMSQPILKYKFPPNAPERSDTIGYTSAKNLDRTYYDLLHDPINGPPKRLANVPTGDEKGYLYLHDDSTNRCYGGTVRNCKTITEEKLEVCKAPDLGKIERYSYIKSANWMYGSESSCKVKPVEIERPNNLNLIKLPNGLPCSYCMCTCDYGDRTKNVINSNDFPRLDTDRYVDLHELVADDGHVITGVRIKKAPNKQRLFQLEIKQAKLLSNGRLSKTTSKANPTYYPRETLIKLGVNLPKKYKEGQDYHKITYNNTVILLDNLFAKQDGKILTGVKFQVSRNKDDGKMHLGLAIRVSDFDVTVGSIKGNKWYSRSETKFETRTRVTVEDLDLPTRFNRQNKEMIDQLAYVELANSGLEADVGQNVLPFIDVQPVETNPPVPLIGVGLYHRGFKGSGGYLALKATTISLKSFLPNSKSLTELQDELRGTDK